MWFELSVSLPGEEIETVSEFLFDLGAVSVTTEDADRDTPDEFPIFGEPGSPPPTGWKHSTLTALFSPPKQPEELLKEVFEALPHLEEARYYIQVLEDLDWVRHIQDQFSPVQISPSLWIVPSWCDIPDPNAHILRLDPGLAFGTGSHPTTKLCLLWLEQHLHPGAKVLDYGCGSGILALAAIKLGASEVVGVDIDPQAVTAARSNAEENKITAAFMLAEECVEAAPADIVVANILANPLQELAPTLLSHLRPGGWLVLSGILLQQAADVQRAYAQASQHRLLLQVWKEEEGWVCLAGQLPLEEKT